MIILSLIHLLFGVSIISIEIIKLKNQKINILFFVMITYGMFFGIAPALLHASNLVGYNHKWNSFMDYGNQHYFTVLLLVIATYPLIISGWKIKVKTQKKIGYFNQISFIPRDLNLLACFFLFISFVSYILYSSAYGGFVGLLSLSNAIRGGWVNIDNKWSFLQRFGGFSMISSYIFFATLFVKKRKITFLNILPFVLSFFFSLFILMTWEGRLTLVYYIITFPISILIMNSKKVKLRKMIGLFILSALILYSSSIIFKYIKGVISGENSTTRIEGSMFNFFITEFSFPTISIGTALHAVYDELMTIRYFKDIPLGLVNLIPKSILGYIPEKISTIHTNFFAIGLQGEIPTDIISLGIYSLGVFGPLVLAFLLGFICRIVQDYINRIELKSLKSICFVVVGLVLGRIVVYADPANFFNGNFSLLISIIILCAFTKVGSCREFYDEN
jgi:hypothetical protein